jgi:NitT/TauT family transport system substrate-binding protein
MVHLGLLAALAVLTGLTWGPVAASPPLPPPERAAAPEPVQTTVVRVGTLNNATDAPFFLAQERGYLREEGLDMETTAFDSGQMMIAPLGADQLDAGGGAVGPGLFNAVLRGIPVRIVADLARAAPGTRFNCLFVRKDLLDSGAVRSFADLRGRVYAEPVPGNVMTYVLERELRQAGVRPDELRYVVVPFPEMMTAFANGIIDVAFPVEPFNTLGAERGIAECWRQTADMMPDYSIAVVLYGPTFAQQRADVARRFMTAYLRGARDYYRAFFGDGQGRGDVIELLTRITPIRDRALLERIGPIWMDPNGAVNVASLRGTQRWYAERGDLANEVDLDRVVDPSFAEYAVGRLGRQSVP